jgi:hypothetical protein
VVHTSGSSHASRLRVAPAGCPQVAATDARVAHLEPLANALQEDNERLLKARGA